MSTRIKRYPLNQSQLYKCSSKKRLAFLLHTDLKKLKEIAGNPKYHTFNIVKKQSVEVRTINAPQYDLKKVQKAMYAYLKKVSRPKWLMSGEIGKNWTDNGKAHEKNPFVIKADINKFFDNCKREYVYSFFHGEMNQSPDVAEICTSLVMVDNKIVQGASTSMVMAFYSYKEMFYELKKLADENNAKFTVYVDDVTFSKTEPFGNVEKFKRRISQITSAYGQKVKKQKSRSYGSHRSKRITGTVVNKHKELVSPNSLRKDIYELYQKFLKEETQLKKDELRSSLLGKIGALRQINPDGFSNIYRDLKLK